jgi:hypothetical protein
MRSSKSLAAAAASAAVAAIALVAPAAASAAPPTTCGSGSPGTNEYFLAGGRLDLQLQETREHHAGAWDAFDVVTTQNGNAPKFQQWRLTIPVGSWAVIENVATGDLLTESSDAHAGDNASHDVVAKQDSYTANQRWIVREDPSNTFELENAATGDVLIPSMRDNYLGNPGWHPLIASHGVHSPVSTSLSRWWHVAPCGGAPLGSLDVSGLRRIPAFNPDSGHEVSLQEAGDPYAPNGIVADGVHPVVFSPASWNTAEQRWTFVEQPDGQYRIINLAHGDALQATRDAFPKSDLGATNVVASPTEWNSPDQLWDLQPSDHGYQLYNAAEDVYLSNGNDVFAASDAHLDSFDGLSDVTAAAAMPASKWHMDYKFVPSSS